MKSPRDLKLPYDDWRKGQRLAMRTALHAGTPHVVIQAATGSGKSLIAAGLTQLDERRWIILTATKGLMSAYGSRFPHLFEVKGTANYECLAARDEFRHAFPLRRGPIMCDDGPCHQGSACTLKEYGCLYFDRYRAAVAHRTVLTNYAYLLAMRRFSNGLGMTQGLICDEAHALPEQLMGACQIRVPKGLFDAPPPTSIAGWKGWAEARLAQLAPGSDDDTRARRSKTVDMLKALARIDRTWAWDDARHEFVFEPTIPRLLMPLLHTFDKASTVVYLSATITPHTLRLLAVDEADVTFHTMRSTFPVERRPVYLAPGVWNNFRITDEGKARLYEAVSDFCDDRDDRRGIIHSVSYTRAREICAAVSPAVRSRIVTHTSAKDLDAAVTRYLTTPNAILVSPSVMTGWDFPYDACEFNVLPKVPYPDTTSRIMQARIAATPGYREHLTGQNLQQACGRGNRAEDDSCETVIFDETARKFIRDNDATMSESFLESVIETRRARITPLPKLQRR